MKTITPSSIITTFKIRPDRRGQWRRKGSFFTVMVMRDIESVRAIYGRGGQNTVAFVRSHNDGKNLGTIVFPRKFGNMILAHEATHAALYFLAWNKTGKTYQKGRLNFNVDEKICLAIGNIAAEITNGLYREGVWK